MISITTVHIHMQIQRWTLCCSDMNILLTSWIQFFDTRRETILKSLSYYTMLTTPQMFGTSHGTISISQHHVVTQLLNIMVAPQLLTIMVGTQLQLSASMADNPTVCLHGPQSTPNWLFFKIFKFLGPSFPDMMSFTLQPHFLSGVYYDNCDCHILCAQYVPNAMHLN